MISNKNQGMNEDSTYLMPRLALSNPHQRADSGLQERGLRKARREHHARDLNGVL
jgi:hypothetical protein